MLLLWLLGLATIPSGQDLFAQQWAAGHRATEESGVARNPPAPPGSRHVALAGSTLVIPVIASAETSTYGKLSTTLEIANVSDAEARYTVRFLGAGGTALSMPVQFGCPTCALPAPMLRAAVAARGGKRITILPGSALRFGWAEFTSEPDASFAVSAVLRAEAGDGAVNRAEIPPAPIYGRAWLYTDNTSGFATSVILVNPSTTEMRTLELRYRDLEIADSTCETRVPLPALGQTVVETGVSLACSSGNRGLIEISGPGEFAGIALVAHAADGTLFTRSLFGRTGPGEQYPLLEHWRVARGTVTYGANTSAGCVAVSGAAIGGAMHTVHTSRWQRRADASGSWTDIEGTGRTGMVCAYTPQADESGQYRGVAEISIDGALSMHASNTITVSPVTAVTTAADLVVTSAVVSDASLDPGQSFEVNATVRNTGTGASTATTLRFYRSSDPLIATSDTEVGTAELNPLSAAGTSSGGITLAAPSTAGRHYYGACVDPVPGEFDTGNNCSSSATVTVRSGSTAATIPDATLRAAIEAALGKASGAPITAAEMGALTGLSSE